MLLSFMYQPDTLVLDWSTDVWRLIVRILVSGIAGFCIGLERKKRLKDAGPRTHAVVAIAACVMMIVSKYGFTDVIRYYESNGIDMNVDVSRIASNIITGISFLGAGMIFYKRDNLHGLTTAAGIWLVAGIGMAIGAGLYIVGLVSSAMIIVIQLVLHSNIKGLSSSHQELIKARILVNDSDYMIKFRQMLSVKRIVRFETNRDGDNISADVDFISEKIFTPCELITIINKNPEILSLEKEEDS